MEQMPQEVVERICSHLPKNSLKAVLTISSNFRFAAERCSGAFEEFTIDGLNFNTFRALYSGHRLLYLRELIFRPSLPDKTAELQDTCRENEEQLLEKDLAFTGQISLLLATLKLVEEQATKTCNPGGYRLSLHGPRSSLDYDSVCHHHLYVSWRLHLLDPNELPQILSVRSFEFYNGEWVFRDGEGWQPRVDLRCIVDLITKFPNLEYLGSQTGGYEWHSIKTNEDAQQYERDWEGPRRDSRHDFAGALVQAAHAGQIPNTLTRASLDFLHPLTDVVQIHHSKPLPNLVGPTLGHDPFSTSLRIMTNHLRELRICAMVDESVFWTGDTTTAPFGPNLEVFELVFHPAHPSGKWYFQGPGGEGGDAIGYEVVTDAFYPPYETSNLDIEMDDQRFFDGAFSRLEHANLQFRIAPNAPVLRPLLSGFAQAAKLMPRLKEAMIWSPLTWGIPDSHGDDFMGYDIDESSELLWGLAYTEPGRCLEKTSSRRFDWMTGQWRPDQDLANLIHGIGHETYGDDFTDVWPEDVSGESVGHRDWANSFMFLKDPGRVAR